ncbi:hypothetical protein L202_07189 [Cryptococcus amylolentus CBS 6039]|uniref:Uncharacterized protein n=2 Tax=Cryptococcus amylolentus TaxID=104669 RepID=A0A1E3HEX6_9TREE|nr:hypothetical protein L202_07189 [Cryptococcus amylolentus CBS 6039]ODN74887.1 hypothetical protein L202_07189 [Cryptococcus amylolentus CBS 6039]ODO01781.1 hypothetical protein I350_06610 [Cryptococcus amylolentus CBS 6273]
MAIAKALHTEISTMEQRGEPVGDMSDLKFSPVSIVPTCVDEVSMVGSIEGQSWSGNGQLFKVPDEPTAAEVEEAKNRYRAEREAGDDEEDVIRDRKVEEVEDDE